MIEFSRAFQDAIRAADWAKGVAAIDDQIGAGLRRSARSHANHYAGPWGTTQLSKDVARLPPRSSRRAAEEAILIYLDGHGCRRVFPGEDGSPTRLYRIVYGGDRFWVAADSPEQCVEYARKHCCEPDEGEELVAEDLTATHLNERVYDLEGETTFYTMRYIMAQVDPPGLVASTVGP